jgi:hypothetical protein
MRPNLKSRLAGWSTQVRRTSVDTGNVFDTHAVSQREESVIVGDRMDTDIVAGIEAGIETVLVLSGVTSKADLRRFAYRPGHVLPVVGAIVGDLSRRAATRNLGLEFSATIEVKLQGAHNG